MNSETYPNHTSIKGLAGLMLAILVAILIFGLWPRGYRFNNNVEWLQEQAGIRFRKYGIAYSQPFKGWAGKEKFYPADFSIELALKLENHQTKGFSFILSLHNGTDSDQLLVGQWRSSIIVMNGDDYDYKRKVGRISVEETSPMPMVQFLTITTGHDGAKVYLNGRVVGTKKNLALKIPIGGQTTLLLGNSVYGRHSWRGEIYGLAFYPHELTAEGVNSHFLGWCQSRNFLYAEKEAPCLLYVFDEKKGMETKDHSSVNQSLIIPDGMRILKKDVLAFAWRDLGFNRIFIQDALMNLLGFIPLGFVLYATLFRFGGRFQRYGVWLTVLLGFTVSLTIEIAQAWLPSRSSQLLDLILNTIGTGIGAPVSRLFFALKGEKGAFSG